MHHDKEEVVCPNCGTQAFGNYCYECGQQTHLHKDTLWGMVLHFFEHYFHYDNKFWKTIKTLLFKPGELTLAYWRQQRMRYISPVSLYIFISALYFGCIILFLPLEQKRGMELGRQMAVYFPNKTKTTRVVGSPIPINISGSKLQNPAVLSEVTERVLHLFPKLFFFLIPITAFVLQLLFLKRKEFFYVDHLIFSIHFHSFYFLLGLVTTILALLPASTLNIVINLASTMVPFFYFRRALQVVYQTSGKRSTWYTFIFVIAYLIILVPLVSIAFYYTLTQIH